MKTNYSKLTFKNFIHIILLFFNFSVFSQVVNTGMTDNFDSLETGKISINGYIDSYYGFDFNQPQNHERLYSVNNTRNQEVNINLAYIDIKYRNENVRGKIAPGFGTYMNSNYINETGSLKYLVEANGGICLSQNRQIWIDAGIFGSPFTNETVISKDHSIYTRSFGAEYSPYYLSGLKLSYPINKKINSYLYVINGWQQIIDPNNSLAFSSQFEYRPNKNLLLNWNTYIGNEKTPASPNARTRYYTDLYGIFDNGGKISYTAGIFYGIQTNEDSNEKKINNFWWQGNITSNLKLNKNTSISARLEYFDDQNSVQIAPVTSVKGFSSYSGSLCFNFKIHNHAMFRIENRYFYSQKNVYINRNNNETNSNNLLIGSLCIWF